MAITVLNNISSLQSQNALAATQTNLQKTLNQLSTGMKINSGADDAAGLSIVSGMNANIAALTQSQQNASNGMGMLQTADGALSQVTTLLNRAVTLATEASNSNITTGANSQSVALQAEYASIASEINQIGSNTNFNTQNVFSTGAQTMQSGTLGTVGTPLLASATLTAGQTIIVNTNSSANQYTFTANAAGTSTIQDAITAINSNVTGATASINSATGKFVVSSADSTLAVTGTDTTVGIVAAVKTSGQTTTNVNNVFISDGTSTANTSITTAMSQVNTTALGITGSLLTAGGAQTELTAINAAINQVSAERGVLGASVNRLTAATTDMSSQVTNLQSAANSLQNADIGKTVANMTQYNVLQSTGMAALQQANQAQQAVLKLVQ
jgi:flagellin